MSTRKSSHKKHRKASGHHPHTQQNHWLFGIHAVLAALANPARIIRRVVLTHEVAKQHEQTLSRLYATAKTDLPAPASMSRDDLCALLPEGAVHQGLAALVAPLAKTHIEDVIRNIEERDINSESKRRTVVVILDQVTDPHNVGAVLRSAAAFGACAVISPERKSAPPTGTLAKTASGALEITPYIGVTNLVRALEQLKRHGFWIYGLSGDGEKSLADALPAQGRIALIMGAEGAGLRRLTREHCDLLVSLPTAPQFHVLNVSAAAAVALYETAREQHDKTTSPR